MAGDTLQAASHARDLQRLGKQELQDLTYMKDPSNGPL